jgi:hypothetical protein
LCRGRKRDDQTAINKTRPAGGHDQSTIWGSREGRDDGLDLAGVALVERADLHLAISALGHKRKFQPVSGMSALPPKADTRGRYWKVRFVPIADIAKSQSMMAMSSGTLKLGVYKPWQTRCELTFRIGHAWLPVNIRAV